MAKESRWFQAVLLEFTGKPHGAGIETGYLVVRLVGCNKGAGGELFLYHPSRNRFLCH